MYWQYLYRYFFSKVLAIPLPIVKSIGDKVTTILDTTILTTLSSSSSSSSNNNNNNNNMYTYSKSINLKKITQKACDGKVTKIQFKKFLNNIIIPEKSKTIGYKKTLHILELG